MGSHGAGSQHRKKAKVVQPDTEPDIEFVCSEEDDEDNFPLAVLRERKSAIFYVLR